MKSTQPTNIAITVGTVLLIGWWTAPFRQQAVNFNMCVEQGMKYSERKYGGWTEDQKRANGVTYCNGGDL